MDECGGNKMEVMTIWVLYIALIALQGLLTLIVKTALAAGIILLVIYGVYKRRKK